MTLEQEFRKAWADAQGESFAARIARQSLEASAEQDPALAMVLFELRNHFQAELDLHLSGASVPEHRANAAEFAELVRGMADAVKEITKGALGRQRMPSGLLISALSAGSVRLILSAAAPAEQEGHIDVARVETQDSNSLRVVATLLSRAGDDIDSETGVIEGLLTALPARARPGIRRIATAISVSDWDVAGELRRPDQPPVELHINRVGARQLLDALESRESETSTLTLVGQVDGQRRSLGTMWFISTAAPPIEASVVQQDLLEQVALLGASGDDAEARFTVVTRFPPGARGAAKRSYVLMEIRPIESASTSVTLDE